MKLLDIGLFIWFFDAVWLVVFKPEPSFINALIALIIFAGGLYFIIGGILK